MARRGKKGEGRIREADMREEGREGVNGGKGGREDVREEKKIEDEN